MFSTLIFQIFTKGTLPDSLLHQTASLLMGCEKPENVILVNKNTQSKDLVVFFFGNTKGSRTVILHYFESRKLYLADAHIFDLNSGKVNLALIRRVKAELVNLLMKENGACQSINNLYAPLFRGEEGSWPYGIFADDRLLQTTPSTDVLVLQSPYQNIRITRDKHCGNVLFLDDDVMFGESDQEAYTRVLLGLETGKAPRHDYTDKEILILGGGDGGVMAELLKQKPKMVVMVEIDEEVIKACRTHLRSVCGDVMDSYEAENKKIIIGDCMKHLHECIESGKTFDFIINDLTEETVSTDSTIWSSEYEEANSQVMEISFKVLKPSGRLLCRGTGITDRIIWEPTEASAKSLGLKFRAFDSFVPSFYEVYRLYEFWRET